MLHINKREPSNLHCNKCRNFVQEKLLHSIDVNVIYPKDIDSIALHDNGSFEKETTIRCILVINYFIVLSLELITMVGTS